MPRLTDTRIRSLKPTGKRYLVWDANGLGVRVGTSGKKSFVYTYREGSKVRWMTLGNYPSLSLAEARERHGKALAAREKGLSPADAELEAKREARETPTVKQLSEYYIEHYAKRRKSSWQEDERLLQKDVIPHLGQLKAHSVRRRDIVDLVEGIADRGAPVTANRTLAVVSKMFNFAVDREILEATPAAGIKRVHKEQGRQRVLSEEEIRRFWNNLPDTQMTEAVRLALRLMLVTAQRRGELAEATWDEFDLSAGWWTIPAEHAKNGLAHRVPLSDLALGLLAQVKALSGASPFLFPSPRRPTEDAGESAGKASEQQTQARPITVRALTRAVDRNTRTIGVEDFTPHDLRRTAASHMAGLGIPRLVISKILNHVEPGITAVYDRHSYDPEKREALSRWAERLRGLVNSMDSEVA
jgi:integrase